MAAVKKSQLKDKGKKTFHPRRISWSYRYLGKEARHQINKNKKKQTFRANQTTPGTQKSIKRSEGGSHPPQNKQAHKLLIRIILAYSPKKNRANPIEEYSTLNPATNSASASGRYHAARNIPGG